eukprot:TRINITY_DN15436_c0_g1_i1.p1 TRINITY_DN15436_c0_g1~~TRINITY_DN15436_c0_g1_i1.p1  ORF type:complete len:267 (-),score=59.53 TRINITY_DN15436_c0_g1_i1:509-1309(-)
MYNISNCGFSDHNFILNENGDLYAFGLNEYGQCGLDNRGKNDYLDNPTKIMNNKKIKSIVVGYCHSFYLEYNGDLYGCGSDLYEQLGKYNTPEEYKFIKLETNVEFVSSVSSFTIIKKIDGKIYFLGKGLERDEKHFEEIIIQDVEQVSCGEDHVLFLKSNGEVWGMGSNENGRLGLEIKKRYLTEPELILSDQNIFSVCCGYQYSFILSRDELKNTFLYCFGKNNFYQLGLPNNKNNQYSPQKNRYFQKHQKCSLFFRFHIYFNG